MRTLFLFSLAALSLLACGTATPPPAAPAPAETASAPAPEATTPAEKSAAGSEPPAANVASFGSEKQTLRFMKDSAAMTNDAKKEADTLAESIKRSSLEAVAVSVKAHSEQDSRGKGARLEAERTKAVVAYLTNHGVASALFAAKLPDGGSITPPVERPAEFFPRVEVTVIFKIGSKK